MTPQDRRMPYLESVAEEAAYRQGYRLGQDSHFHEKGAGEPPQPVNLAGAQRHEFAAFTQGHRDGVADADRDISATLVQYEEWYFRNGYERA